MKKKKRVEPASVPVLEKVIEALKECEPISPRNTLGMKMALGNLSDKKWVEPGKIDYIARLTQDPYEIAEYLLRPYEKKERKKRQDSTPLGWYRFSEKYKGRRPSEKHALFKRVFDIIIEMLKEPSPKGNNYLEYCLEYMNSTRSIIERYIQAAHKGIDPLALGLSTEEALRADEKLMIFCELMRSFADRIIKAQHSKLSDNLLFLSTIKEVFKDDARYYIGKNTVRGKKIDHEKVIQRWRDYWTNGEHTTRHNDTVLCFLAWYCHTLFSVPAKKEQLLALREMAKLKIELLLHEQQHLIQKYEVPLEEVRWDLRPVSEESLKAMLKKLEHI